MMIRAELRDGVGRLANLAVGKVPEAFSAIQTEGYKSLQQGDEVEFEIEQGPKGPQAVRVIRVSKRKAS